MQRAASTTFSLLHFTVPQSAAAPFKCKCKNANMGHKKLFNVDVVKLDPGNGRHVGKRIQTVGTRPAGGAHLSHSPVWRAERGTTAGSSGISGASSGRQTPPTWAELEVAVVRRCRQSDCTGSRDNEEDGPHGDWDLPVRWRCLKWISAHFHVSILIRSSKSSWRTFLILGGRNVQYWLYLPISKILIYCPTSHTDISDTDICGCGMNTWLIWIMIWFEGIIVLEMDKVKLLLLLSNTRKLKGFIHSHCWDIFLKSHFLEYFSQVLLFSAIIFQCLYQLIILGDR